MRQPWLGSRIFIMEIPIKSIKILGDNWYRIENNLMIYSSIALLDIFKYFTFPDEILIYLVKY
ncbi:hypothetical protein NQ314_013269 [Rhamnusium bicolor]|uniref:Uncharacterized protein n=1 Tax=Rhamnusium bicolor TaxID=1586634 RepID=A0AAV8X7S5_9CUCU|nr:hypothetical protein NQ314_013269 [Rhamnusium bicolor]